MVRTDTLTFTLTMDEPQKAEKDVPSLCVGCGLEIRDRFVLNVFPDLRWHEACLKCVECQQNLDESHTCFIKDGKTLCKDDYIRLYTSKCAKCLKSFSSQDYVMRAGVSVYHVQCFRCEGCDRLLLQGDEFTIRDGLLHCTDHEESNPELITLAHDLAHVTELDRCDEGAGTSRSGGEGDFGWPVSSIKLDKTEKNIRIRTTLSQSQLYVLRTYYNANPRPNALDKEYLMEMTGLSSRVIRVWFQNKRCKDKKKRMLGRQMQEEYGGQNEGCKDKKKDMLERQTQQESREQNKVCKNKKKRMLKRQTQHQNGEQNKVCKNKKKRMLKRQTQHQNGEQNKSCKNKKKCMLKRQTQHQNGELSKGCKNKKKRMLKRQTQHQNGERKKGCKDKKKRMTTRQTQLKDREQRDMTDEPSSAVTPMNLDLNRMHPVDLQSLLPSWTYLRSLLHLESDPTLDEDPMFLNQLDQPYM